MSETQLVRSIIGAINLSGLGHAQRLQAGTLFLGGGRGVVNAGEPGTPDIIVLLKGERVVWLEAKTAKGKLRPSQKAWHERAAKLGHTVAVVRSVDDALTAVRTALRGAA